MKKREDHHYPPDPTRPWIRRKPLRIVEAVHRWRHRHLYAMLPEFYQDFYPITNAVSLTMQYAKHTIESGRSMDALASQTIRKVVDLEKCVCDLRLALAAAKMGWNEDQVDRFMSMWFGRHDLPTKTD